MKPRYLAIISPDECKGCGRCVPACPAQCLTIGNELNRWGFRHACPAGPPCRGCGNCFYACPEPGAITILELDESVQNTPPIPDRNAAP